MDVNKLKVGVAFVEESQVFRVLKYDFTKMGRGGATIKVKARNLHTGSIVTKSYHSGNVVERADLEKKQLQYLYADGDSLYFMDPSSFEQMEMEKKIVGKDANYLIEGEKAWVLFWGEKVLGVEVPASVVMRVSETGSSDKGNSTSNVLKRARMENGLVVNVPMFIKERDRIKINTVSGEYVSRVN